MPIEVEPGREIENDHSLRGPCTRERDREREMTGISFIVGHYEVDLLIFLSIVLNKEKKKDGLEREGELWEVQTTTMKNRKEKGQVDP